MSLTIYGIIFSGPLMHTDTPSGTVLIWDFHLQNFGEMLQTRFLRIETRGQGYSDPNIARENFRKLKVANRYGGIDGHTVKQEDP